jgi:hypothetical protein
MVSGVASTLPNLAVKPKRRGQSLVELPLISPSIADRLARRAPNSYMLSGKQMEEAMGMLIIRHKVKDYGKWRPMLPTGWDRLSTYPTRWPDATRTIAEVITDWSGNPNAALCPKHAAELEALLTGTSDHIR